MPNTSNDDVIIVGSLSDKDLRKSIDDLVNYVADKTTVMAMSFEKAMDKMKSAMKDFAITQKVSVDLMQDAWKQMSSSFDAMLKAQQTARSSSGGGGSSSSSSGSSTYDDDTVGKLQETIALEEKRRKEMKLGSDELRTQNQLIEEQKAKLRRETTSDRKKLIQVAKKVLQTAFTMPARELSDAEKKLQQLQSLSAKFQGKGILDPVQWNRLQTQIQSTQEKINRLRQTKPTSMRDVMGMDESSVDAIAAKMKALKGLSVGNPTEAKQLADEYQRLSRRQAELLGKNVQLTHSNNYLAQSFGYIRNRIVYMLTLGAITSFTKQVYEIRGQYELLERSLGVLVNSFQKGSQIFRELNDMAIRSPFTLMELAGAAKQLTAYNFAADEVVDTTRRLADISAALGVPMERLTYNLGQIRAQTVLTARDARDFANAGLPIVKSLADYYTELEGKVVSTGDVYDRMSKKAVAYADVMAVLNKMTDEGGKFFDFQAKQAETLRVQMNNLTLAWNNMLNDIGKSNQWLLELPLKGLKEIFEQWENISRILTNLVIILGSAKVAQMAFNMALSKTNIETIREVALKKNATAQDYQLAMSKMNLTKAQAKWLISMSKGNVALKEAIINLGLLSRAEANAAATTNLLRNRWIRLTTSMSIMWSGLVKGLNTLKTALLGFATNPATWIFALSYVVTDLIMDFKAASDAAQELNDTISRRTKENSESIGKFLSDYAKSFDKLSSGNMELAEQQKLWDAIKEEIKKSSQNASEYLAKLEGIANLSERNKLGGDILTNIKLLQDAAQAASEQGKIAVRETIGYGGMLEHGLVEQLKDFVDELNDAAKEAEDDFDGFENKFKKINDVLNHPDLYRGGSVGDWAAQLVGDAEALNKAWEATTKSIAESMKTMWPDGVEKNSENVREYITSITNAIKESHPEIKGQLERTFDVITDQFIANQIQTFAGVKNNNEILLQSTYSSWEVFFEKLRSVGGKEFEGLMDYVVKTGDFSNERLQQIWEQASKNMQNEAHESYLTIERFIDDLNTKQVIIPVFFQQAQQALTDLQQDFNETFIYNNLDSFDYDKYTQKLLANQRKYGKLNQKEGETTLAWNKRLNDLYNEQYANIAQQDKIMKSIGNTSSIVYQQAEKTKKDYEEQMQATKEVAEHEGFILELTKKKTTRGGRKDEDLVAQALKQEIQLIKEMRGNYDKLRKSGVSDMEAINLASRGYEATILRINSVLQKFGIDKFNAANFAGKDVRSLLQSLEEQRNELLKSGKVKTSSLIVLDGIIKDLRIDVKTDNMKKITEGLNNELGKLKEEYELAVELDANPELGNIFADFMGINIDDLPRTFQDAAKKAQEGIDEVFERYGRTDKIDIASMLNKESFDKWVKESGLDLKGALVQEVEKFRQFLHKVQVDENKNITQGWANLVQKYGDLQSKLLKIYKDSVQEQMNIVRKFGDSGEIAEALDLSKLINLSQDPAEITRLQEQLARIIKSVVDRNPQALNFTTAIENKTKTETAKATWEDFKNSDMYTMTFEDMSYNSTRAIQLIIDKLNALKDEVKEDPASMKALIKSLEDAEKELNARDPFGGIVRSINSMAEASKETKLAQQELATAEKDVAQAQQKADESEDATPEERASAQQELAEAIKRRTAAQLRLTKAESAGKKAQENLKASLQETSNQLGNVQNLFGVVSKLFRAGGDDETADAIDAISEGFSIMTTVIMGVVAAMVVLESTTPWLLAIAAALSVVVGLFSFLSGNEDNKITKKVEESERAVKRLELAYVDLQHAVDNAYGTAVIGAKQATLANKELQLAELQRQIQLEKSRDSKKRDEDKIIDLQKQYRELFYEIQDGYKEIVDDIMGTDVASFAEDLVSSMITAFKQGEDYMKVFGDKFDEMIDNMIMKSIVSRVVAQYMDDLWESIDSRINERSKNEADEYEKAQQEAARRANMSDAEIIREMYGGVGMIGLLGGADKDYKRIADEYRKAAMDEEKAAKERLDAATMFADSDIDYVMSRISEVTPELGEKLKEILGRYYTFGETSDKQLSALQQGIQGITEDTAGALEAYMNGVSQQVYLHSDLLTQIRDAVVGFDMDVQLGVLSQMLLQLQQSYQVQQNIEMILNGVLNPSGRAIVVELNS